MPTEPSPIWLPSPLIALAGWLVPGAGYMLIGERVRGLIVLITLIALYGSGILIAGVRVIEVPGFNKNGFRTQLISEGGRGPFLRINAFEPTNSQMEADPPHKESETVLGWSLPRRFTSEIANKPWIVPQVLAGPMALLGAYGSIAAAQAGVGRVHAPLETIGTLYTAIAGMLNLYIIIDSVHRAGSTEA